MIDIIKKYALSHQKRNTFQAVSLANNTQLAMQIIMIINESA